MKDPPGWVGQHKSNCKLHVVPVGQPAVGEHIAAGRLKSGQIAENSNLF